MTVHVLRQAKNGLLRQQHGDILEMETTCTKDSVTQKENSLKTKITGIRQD